MIFVKLNQSSPLHSPSTWHIQPQWATLNPDELSGEVLRTPTAVGEEEESISSFEEAFQHAKEATGVTDSQVRADSINPMKPTVTDLI